MNFDNKVVIAKGKNVTFDISAMNYDIGKCIITFKNGKTFNYNSSNVKIISDYKALDAKLYTIVHNGRELFDIASIKVFSMPIDKVWRVTFGNGKVSDYFESELEISKSCLDDKDSVDCLHYLSRMADLNDLTDEDGNKILAGQYKKIAKVDTDTALAAYLNPVNPELLHDKTISDKERPVTPIFPFGCNTSQYSAVQNALSNNISIIEGPPGTGKTQTILNIIANLIINGKTVQIVSNNNAATDNVLEKMAEEKYAIDFIAARLGSKANKELFIENQTGQYPDIKGWKYEGETNLLNEINALSAELGILYSKQQELAKLKEELSATETEYKHFLDYCDYNDITVSDTKIRSRCKSENVIKLINKMDNTDKISFVMMFIGLIICGVGNFKLYKQEKVNVISALQYAYYVSKIAQFTKDISGIEGFLSANDLKPKESRLRKLSLCKLKDFLYTKYYFNVVRPIFADKTMFTNPDKILSEYPVILSTTFSSMSSLKTKFDYIIIDESSQADISTGVLALCSARNAVIVGDSCQLPFVLSDEKKRIAREIFGNYKLSESYDFSNNSFLDSAKKVYKDAPVTVLQEHYRCHPKIIGFCNAKFYDGQLIVMTEDNDNASLSAIKTVAGDHAREKFNQRQIEVIVNEILPQLDYEPDEIGIIAPYNDQINRLKNAVANEEVKISTVHKFQGREKKVIIFCTVDNKIKEFVDNPKLLNVAISRAEDKFILVTCHDNGDGNISDLISYIEYNNLEVSESKIYSVFDLLYKANTEERIKYLSSHRKISEYDSENLMYAALTDMLKDSNELDIACHVPLGMIIRDRTLLSSEELKYVSNSLTHVDFMIYSKVSKKVVLIIEVDGFHFHKEGTRQADRDKIKDAVLSKYELPFIRLSTTGSNEIKKISIILKILSGDYYG